MMLLWIMMMYQSILTMRPHRRQTTGQGLVEYSLIIVFIAIVVIGVVAVLGNTICAEWYVEIVDNSVFGGGSIPQCIASG